MAYMSPLVIDPSMVPVLVVTIWALFWDGLGLWYSARNREKTWFLLMLVFKTVGVLPIIYVFLFSKTPLLEEIDRWGKKKSRRKRATPRRKKKKKR